MAEEAVMETLDKHDIQGLVRRGYGHLRTARFLLCTVRDATKARAYLRECVDKGKITPATDHHRSSPVMHVAFSAAGLEALGVPKAVRATFAREFLEGMDDRSGVLGDEGENAPTEWQWGRRRDLTRPQSAENQPIHVMILLYAAHVDAEGDETDDAAELDGYVDAEKAAFQGGLEVAVEQKTSWLPDEKEHFGFRDGIAKVGAKGFGEGDSPGKQLRTFENGEFVLGYKNEYGHYPEGPLVGLGDTLGQDLPLTPDRTARDLGKNGTYLVYRQLEQRVYELWKHMKDVSREPAPDELGRVVGLAAKMVGRWPDGAPLVKHPRLQPPLDPEKPADNDFLYFEGDRDGTGCPVGSHIRRTNPRDHLGDNGPGVSAEMVRKHQIMRRARAFGAPVNPSMKPEDVLRTEGKDTEVRGLHFMCLVGHINRQFEFMQNAWVKSPVFGGLTADGDPIIGGRRRAPQPNHDDEFTCPADPVRRKYRELPQFTRLLGGGYFFLPGMTAIKYIAAER
jgi:deferrochelatase/peroxidase EfeB